MNIKDLKAKIKRIKKAKQSDELGELNRQLESAIIAEFRQDIEAGKVSGPDDTPDLLHLCGLLESGNFTEAKEFARQMDTYPREGIRKRVWRVILQSEIQNFDLYG